MSDGTSKSSGQVRSLTRALTMLRHLAESGDGMSLTELSEAASLPPSTTHRLLTTLESERFVRPDPQGGLWRIGVAAFFVGTAFARSRDKLTLARPYLRRLMETSGETANLFVESDGEAICIGQIESRHAMRAITGVGGRVLLHSSGAGKVLLAHMEAARRQRILATMALPTAGSSRPRSTRYATSVTPSMMRSTHWACAASRHRCLTSSAGPSPPFLSPAPVHEFRSSGCQFSAAWSRKQPWKRPATMAALHQSRPNNAALDELKEIR